MCGVCGMYVDWRYYRHNLTTISRSFDLDHWHKSATRLRLFTRRHIEFYTHDTRRPSLKTKENTCEDCPRLSSRLWTYVANIYCEHHEYLDTYDDVSLNISTTCNVPRENKQGSFLIYTSGPKRSAVALSMLQINEISVRLKEFYLKVGKTPVPMKSEHLPTISRSYYCGSPDAERRDTTSNVNGDTHIAFCTEKE